MKNLIFGLIATVLFSTLTFGQESKIVGVKNGNDFVLNIYSREILSKINNVTNNEFNMTSIEIKEGYDSELRQTYFYLLIKNDANSAAIAFSLKLNNRNFEINQNSGTVTCTGCAYGCSPMQVSKLWYCSGGCGYDCKKSETVTTKAFLSML
ncbi:MAG: hypothetical protein ACOVLC_04205 [Flavobacterium sp.]